MNELFVIASRKKYRYQHKGLISTEDLWDLKLEDLDVIYKNLNAELKTLEGEESLLAKKKNEAAETVKTKIEIIKVIAGYKRAEAQKRADQKKRSQEYQNVLALIEEKQHEELKNKSVDELMKLALVLKPSEE